MVEFVCPSKVPIEILTRLQHVVRWGFKELGRPLSSYLVDRMCDFRKDHLCSMPKACVDPQHYIYIQKYIY